MPDSDVSRIVAFVPSCSGAYGSSTAILIAAWLSVVSLIVLDRADPPAADLDVVVLHELARVLEHQRVLVAARPAEDEQVRREHHDEQERAEAGRTRDRHPRLSATR